MSTQDDGWRELYGLPEGDPAAPVMVDARRLIEQMRREDAGHNGWGALFTADIRALLGLPRVEGDGVVRFYAGAVRGWREVREP